MTNISVNRLRFDTGTALTEQQKLTAEKLAAFAEEFASPSGEAKPYIRWWASPGNMQEDEVRAEIRKMAEAGLSYADNQKRRCMS